MDSAQTSLYRIEAMPGGGRYAVTFRASGAAEQSAVAQVSGGTVEVASASLPPGWQRESAAFGLLVDAVLAMDRACSSAKASGALVDVDGGWDVMLGNVTLVGDVVTCAAHGAMDPGSAGEWHCPAEDCGARAVLVESPS